MWHHAAATYDGTTFRLYLDGALGRDPRGRPAGERRRDVSDRHRLGAQLATGVADGFFAGQIDEARIWNVARSLAQIQAAMNSEISTAADLLGRWDLNEGFWTRSRRTAPGRRSTARR